jgi:hypothetical protein
MASRLSAFTRMSFRTEAMSPLGEQGSGARLQLPVTAR